MASSVGLRPNHYEALGLSPEASQEEINRAFAKRMSMFGARPMTAAADTVLAYEVLRDPVKRQAYDRALGLTPEPEPLRPTIPVGDRGFIGWGSSAAANRVTFDSLPRSAAEVAPPPGPEPKALETTLASIVASLREIQNQEAREAVPHVKPQPEIWPQAEAPLEVRLAPRAEELLTARFPEDERQHHSFEWRRAALVLGGLVVVAGGIGALGGISAKNAEDRVTVLLPPAKPYHSTAVVPSVAQVSVPTQTQPELPVRAKLAEVRPRHSVSPAQSTPPAEQQADQSPQLASAPTEAVPAVAASDPLAVDPGAAKPVAASLPLSNKMIARTIERIGYACGEVSSAAAVEGASPGTFKVTCSSGQTYQAALIRGRYHFRRWDRD